MLYRFLGLRHHPVIRGNHQNNNVRRLGATGAHGGERLMARRIQEGDRTARRIDMVSANMLGNATRFSTCHLGPTDVVEQ